MISAQKHKCAVFCGELKSKKLFDFLYETYNVKTFKTNSDFYNSCDVKLENIEIIVLTVDSILTKEFLEKMPNLVLVVSLTTSVTHIARETLLSLQAAQKLITLRNFWDQMEDVSGAADLALTFILMGARKIAAGKIRKFNNLNVDRDNDYISHEFSSLRIGIIGYGRIGKRVGKYLKGLGINVVIYDVDTKKTEGELVYKSVAELLNNVHGALISVSVDDHRSKIISKDLLKNDLNNKELFLVNISRGEIVAEEEILASLEQSRISCYLTDVISGNLKHKLDKTESRRFKKLSELGKIVVTPHLGGFTVESTEKTQNIVAHFLLGRFTV